METKNNQWFAPIFTIQAYVCQKIVNGNYSVVLALDAYPQIQSHMILCLQVPVSIAVVKSISVRLQKPRQKQYQTVQLRREEVRVKWSNVMRQDKWRIRTGTAWMDRLTKLCQCQITVMAGRGDRNEDILCMKKPKLKFAKCCSKMWHFFYTLEILFILKISNLYCQHLLR